MSNFITLFAKTEEEVTVARDLLKQNFPEAMLNYHHASAYSKEISKHKCYRDYAYSLTLMFNKSGKENYREVDDLATQMYIVLNDSGPTRGAVLRCDDSKRAHGMSPMEGRIVAQRFILGKIPHRGL